MSSIPKHISKQFDNELEDVRARVLAMGGLVERQLENAMQSLIEVDMGQANSVIETEVQVNTMEVAIDEECTRILARRQPTAGDLRLITAVIKTITDLERVGDEAEKVARMAIDLMAHQENKPYYAGIISLGQLARTILHDALDAFARMDSGAALVTAGMEPKSDEQYGGIMRELITYMMEDPHSISSVIDAVWVARALERIADHSRNICEYVIYLVEGKDVRHISIAQMEQEVRG